MKNKKWTYNTIIYGVVSLLLIILYLFLPLDTIKDFNANGLKILMGTYEQKSIGSPRIILSTSSFNFIPVLFTLAIFLFYLIVSSEPVKRLSSLIVGMISFLYIILIPVIAFYWRNLNYDQQMDITKAWGWYVLIAIYFAFIIYMLIDLILTIKKEKMKLSDDQM